MRQGYAQKIQPDEVSQRLQQNDYTHFAMDYAWLRVAQPVLFQAFITPIDLVGAEIAANHIKVD